MSSNTNPESSTEKEIDYSKLIPFATGGLLLLGISRLLIYYRLFGINILNFLEFGEIITSFLHIATFSTVALSVYLVYILGIKMKLKKVGDKTKDLLDKSKKEQNKTGILQAYEDYKKHSYKAIRKYLVIVVISIIIMGLALYSLNSLKYFIVVLVILAITITLVIYINESYKKHESKLFKDLCLIAIVLLLSEPVIIMESFFEYRSVKYNNKNITTRITFNNEIFLKDSSHVFVSDSFNFYIGQTNKYIFIHHSNENATSVYPISSVMTLYFKEDNRNSYGK